MIFKHPKKTTSVNSSQNKGDGTNQKNENEKEVKINKGDGIMVEVLSDSLGNLENDLMMDVKTW